MMTDDTKERAEKGREILKSRAAQGEPGTKQPAHKEAADRAQSVVDDLKKVAEKNNVETRGPSAGGVQNHPVPPHERTTSPITGGGLQAAAGAVAAAQAHIESELIAEARRTSDPRWELDQKKFEMGQRRELALVPPAPEELAAQGVNPEVVDELPKSPQEQVDRDMPRLKQAEETAKQVKGAQSINPTVENATRDAETRTGTGRPGTSGGVNAQRVDRTSEPDRASSPTPATPPKSEPPKSEPIK